MASGKDLAAAVEADLVAHVSVLYEHLGAVHREPDAVWFITGLDSPHHNGVLRVRAEGAEVLQLVDRLLVPFDARRLPLQWWIFTPPTLDHRPLDRALGARGFMLAADLPGMAADLRSLRAPSPPEGVDVARVRDEAGFSAWADVVGRAFDSPEFADGPSVSAFRRCGFGDAAPFRHFLCRSGGSAVGASTLSLGAGVAGLANIAVVPERRGRGIGTAAASAALFEAQGLGISIGVLSAGELGLPLYERLGFRTVSRHRTYLRTPAGAPNDPRGGA